MLFLRHRDSCLYKVPRWQRMLSSARHSQLGWCTLSHEHVVYGELRQAVMILRHERSVDTSFGTVGVLSRDSFVNTSTVPGVAGCASAGLANSSSKPISISVPPVPVALFADVSAVTLYTPRARSNLIRLQVTCVKIVPPELRNTMMWPLSAACPNDMIDFCKQIVDSTTCAQ